MNPSPAAVAALVNPSPAAAPAVGEAARGGGSHPPFHAPAAPPSPVPCSADSCSDPACFKVALRLREKEAPGRRIDRVLELPHVRLCASHAAQARVEGMLTDDAWRVLSISVADPTGPGFSPVRSLTTLVFGFLP